jgi:putative OPT family oligopeptide transporter
MVEGQKKYVPYVSPGESIAEFTWKSVILGAVLSVIMTMANAYMALKVGMTVAACFPAAVIAMGVLRLFKGTILEENLTRTAASAGESLVAGVAFTLPAMIYLGLWDNFNFAVTTIVALLGGTLGTLFVVLFRTTIVNDMSLPYPEAYATAEVVKAGQRGGRGGMLVLLSGIFGAVIKALQSILYIIPEGVSGLVSMGKSSIEALKIRANEGFLYWETPMTGPAYFGVGYIIGPKLAALMFGGSVLAYFAIYPLSMYIFPDLVAASGRNLTYYYMRQIGAGAMITAACYTIFSLRGVIVGGIKKAVGGLTSGLRTQASTVRTENDIPFGLDIALIMLIAIPLCIFYYFSMGNVVGAIVALLAMVLLAFVFSIVSAHIVSLVGSSNNPVSGMAILSVVITALFMVVIGLRGEPNSDLAKAGLAATILVGTTVCAAAAIGGDMTQDLKIGHMLGGTPWKLEVAEIIGIVAGAPVIGFVFNVLLEGAQKAGETLGSPSLPAPQSGVMSVLAEGIVTGTGAWPLLLVGIIIGIAIILLGVPSPMLVAIGMYLGVGTTFAVFLGGVARWITERIWKSRNLSEEQIANADRKGTLIATGMIAGEAITGILGAFLVVFNIIPPSAPTWSPWNWDPVAQLPIALVVFAAIMFVLTYFTARKKAYE